MITCKNLTISFDEKVLFTSLHVTIPSHCAILGENGAGKSSLAKAICNFIPYEGEIYIDNAEVKSLDSTTLHSKISYIPAKLENADAYLKVYDFVLMGRYLYKAKYVDYSKEDRAMVDAILEKLSLLHVKDNCLDTISSGESQLVLIAQALLTSSSILIFDEPTANLDPRNAHKIFTLLRELKATHTVILITHDIHLAESFNEEVIFIQQSKALPFSVDTFFTPDTLSTLYEANFDENLRVVYV